MNNPQNDITLVERYFEQTLSTEQKEALETRLRDDAELRKIFEQERQIIAAIRLDGLRKDLAFLEERERELTARGREVYINTQWRYLAVAASIAIIALVLFKPWLSQSDRLFKQYFQAYPNVFETTVRGGEQAGTGAAAYQAYEQGDFETAADLFTILVRENNDPGVLLLLGNAQLMNDDTDKAQATLLKLLDEHNSLDDEAKWYLGLIALKEGRAEEAERYFAEVASADNVFSPNATDVLSRLRD